MTGNVRFLDSDGDVVLLSVRWQDCGNGPEQQLDVYQGEVRHLTSGLIFFTILISTDCQVGTYTIRISVVDGQGHVSNTLVVPYIITEPIPAQTTEAS